MNINNWIDSLMGQKQRIAIPIMTHPGIELLGKRVIDAVTDGQIHFEVIDALQKRFPNAAACTVIMDLTVEAEAFGAQIHFTDDAVPSVMGRLLSSMNDVKTLAVPTLDAGRISEYLRAGQLAASSIAKPVLGGCIGPYSLAGRLFDMSEIMMAIYTEPDTARLLLDKCTQFITDYCLAIKRTGVAGVIMAEPAAGLLSDEDCYNFSSIYVKKIVDAVQDDSFAVILHNCGNTGHCTRAMTSVGAKGYHFGNRIDMVAALREAPSDVLVMGNLDPVSIFKMASPDQVTQATGDLLRKTEGYANFVISSGCDTPPQVPFENIEAFFRAVDDYNGK